MKIKEIRVRKSRKIQIEQFEPYEFEYGATVEVDDGERTEEALKIAEDFVDRKIEFETLKWKDPQKLIRRMNPNTRSGTPIQDDVNPLVPAPDDSPEDYPF